MLRIETTRSSDVELVILLAGKLSSDHLPELARLIADAARSGLDVALDLESVMLADRESIVFLADAAASKRARLLRTPSYVREWVRLEALHANPANREIPSGEVIR